MYIIDYLMYFSFILFVPLEKIMYIIINYYIILIRIKKYVKFSKSLFFRIIDISVSFVALNTSCTGVAKL